MSWLIEEDDRDHGFIASDSVIDISSSPVRIEQPLSLGIADHDNDVSVAESSKMAGKQAEYTKSEATMAFSSPVCSYEACYAASTCTPARERDECCTGTDVPRLPDVD